MNRTFLYVDVDGLKRSGLHLSNNTVKTFLMHNEHWVYGSYFPDKKSGRIYCKKENWFNPVTAQKTDVLKYIIPFSGKNLYCLDYSRFDLTTLQFLFDEYVDYTFIQEQMNVDRTTAKSILFDVLYGSTHKRLVQKYDNKTIELLFDNYKSIVLKLLQKQEEIAYECKQLGYFKTPFGRIISLNTILETVQDKTDYKEIGRIGLIYYVMNTSADIFKSALNEILNIKRVRVLTQRFDSIFIEDSVFIDDIVKIMKHPQILNTVTGKNFQYDVKIKTGNTLYEIL
jgi:hypothetical protein